MDDVFLKVINKLESIKYSPDAPRTADCGELFSIK